jgi:hypothetical protein
MMRWDVAGFVGAARQAMPIRWVVQGPHALQPGQRAQLQARLQNFLTQCRLSRAPTQWANGALPDGSRYRLYAHNGATEVVVQPASPTLDKSKGLLLGGLVRCVGAMVGPAPGGQSGTVPWYQFFKENRARPTDVPKYVATRKLYAKSGQQTPQETFGTFWRHDLTGAAAVWAQYGRGAGALYARYFERVGVKTPSPNIGQCVLITDVGGRKRPVALSATNADGLTVVGVPVEVVTPSEFGVNASQVPARLLQLFGGIPIPPQSEKWSAPVHVVSGTSIRSAIGPDAFSLGEHTNQRDFGALLQARPGSDHADWMVGFVTTSTADKLGAHLRVSLVATGSTSLGLSLECMWRGYATWEAVRNAMDPVPSGTQVLTHVTHDHEGLVTFTRTRTDSGTVAVELTRIRGTTVSEDVVHAVSVSAAPILGASITVDDQGRWSASRGEFSRRVLNHSRVQIDGGRWLHTYDLQYTYRAESSRTGSVRYDVVNGGVVQFFRTPGVWGVHSRDADGWENNGTAQVHLDYTQHVQEQTATPDYYETTISRLNTEISNISTTNVIAGYTYGLPVTFEGSASPMAFAQGTQRTDFANWRLNKSAFYAAGKTWNYAFEAWCARNIPSYSGQLIPPNYLGNLPKQNLYADAYIAIECSHIGGVQIIPRLVNVSEQIKPPDGFFVGSLVDKSAENEFKNSVDIFCIGSTQE